MNIRLLVLISLFASATRAFGADCSELPPTSVEVKLLDSPIQTNFRFSYKALKGMSDKYAQVNTEVLGLTTGKAVARVSTQSSVIPDRSGRWECASHQIKIAFGFDPLIVYVGREFPKDSCGFNEIYAHEQRHAKIYQDHARALATEINDTLQQRFEQTEPMRGPAGTIRAKVQQELQERWMPYIQRMLAKAEADQRDVDTREEYERVMASCNGEIRKIVQGK